MMKKTSEAWEDETRSPVRRKTANSLDTVASRRRKGERAGTKARGDSVEGSRWEREASIEER
jgi:hypothetical protein